MFNLILALIGATTYGDDVKQLGSPSFHEREEAHKRLLHNSDKLALIGLYDGSMSQNPEIQLRSNILLNQKQFNTEESVANNLYWMAMRQDKDLLLLANVMNLFCGGRLTDKDIRTLTKDDATSVFISELAELNGIYSGCDTPFMLMDENNRFWIIKGIHDCAKSGHFKKFNVLAKK